MPFFSLSLASLFTSTHCVLFDSRLCSTKQHLYEWLYKKLPRIWRERRRLFEKYDIHFLPSCAHTMFECSNLTTRPCEKREKRGWDEEARKLLLWAFGWYLEMSLHCLHSSLSLCTIHPRLSVIASLCASLVGVSIESPVSVEQQQRRGKKEFTPKRLLFCVQWLFRRRRRRRR